MDLDLIAWMCLGEHTKLFFDDAHKPLRDPFCLTVLQTFKSIDYCVFVYLCMCVCVGTEDIHVCCDVQRC